MKGIVFTEFLDLVEDKFGLEMVDKIIEQSELQSGGAYTSVGTYDFSEMLQLLKNLSSYTGISIDDLLLVYAEHFFSVLEENYPSFFKMYTDLTTLVYILESKYLICCLHFVKYYPSSWYP